MTFLAMDRARDDTVAYFQATVPAQITLLNAARPTKHQMQADFSTYAATPLLAQPETPALYVIPSALGFRGTNWGAVIDQQHQFDLCVEVGNADEEVAMQDMLGYLDAVLNALEQFVLRTASMAHGQQILFGTGTEGQEASVIRFQSVAPQNAGQPFYAQAILPITVFQSEAP